jgi:flagellar motility protein MotE (MotC chaperone)
MNGAKAPTSPAERAILERLGERREEIDARMRELEMRERLLDTAEKKLDSRVGDLKAMEEKADGPGGKVREEEAKAVKNLVIMYEAMKPKEAARVFDRLGLDVLVPVVQQMNPRKMSEVLAAMSPERAEKLTVALATTARSPGIERAAADLAPLGGNELPAITPAPRR